MNTRFVYTEQFSIIITRKKNYDKLSHSQTKTSIFSFLVVLSRELKPTQISNTIAALGQLNNEHRITQSLQGL